MKVKGERLIVIGMCMIFLFVIIVSMGIVGLFFRWGVDDIMLAISLPILFLGATMVLVGFYKMD